MIKLNVDNKHYLLSYYLFVQIIHGIVLTFAFAPFDVFIALAIAFSGFLWALEKHCKTIINPCEKTFWKLGFYHAFVFFFSHFITSLYWLVNPLLIDIKRYFWLIPFALLIAPAILSLFYAILSGFTCVLLQRYCNDKKLYVRRVSFAISYTIIFWIAELLRSHLIVSFPWNLLGYASCYSISLMQLASVIGVYGLSLFLYFIGTALYTRNIFYLTAVSLLFIYVTLWGNTRLTNNHQEVYFNKTMVHIIQPNIAEIDKRQDGGQDAAMEKIIKIMKNVSTEECNLDGDSQQKIHLIILPEAGIPFLIDKNQHNILKDVMSSYENNTFIITGVDRYSYVNKKYYNSMIVVNNCGDIMDSYDKNVLVPFGEYIPLQEYIDSFLPIVGKFGSFSPGNHSRNIKVNSHESNNVLISNSFSFIPHICYESIFSPIIYLRGTYKIDAMINITNDGWLGNSIGPYQHFAMARMRAIEYGLPMIRVANTGISGIIDMYGNIIAEIGLDKEGTISHIMPQQKEITTYLKFINMLN